jgi:chitin synthase
MTMYNEDDVLFLRTLNAVIKNIAHLTTRTRSKTWGPESWQKVVVCIVADGRKVIDSRVLKILQLMGVYAEVSPSLFFSFSLFFVLCREISARERELMDRE